MLAPARISSKAYNLMAAIFPECVSDDEGGIKVGPGALYRYASIYHTGGENQGKPQLDEHLNAIRPVIASNEVHFHQMRALELYNKAHRGEEKEKRNRV